jgi:two pore calcium channel protein
MSLLVLLTTANFPDVMLPAYKVNRLWAFFFISFLVLCLFFFMNMLLAIFYNNYKARIEEALDNFKDNRHKFLMEIFDSHDKDKDGSINK